MSIWTFLRSGLIFQGRMEGIDMARREAGGCPVAAFQKLISGKYKLRI